MAQRKDNPTWTNLERTSYDSMLRFLRDSNMKMSEFVRECIIARLLDEGYLQQEQLEEIMIGR